MGNEIDFHLSRGVFFNLILAARKKKTGKQETCLKDLLYIYDRSIDGITGNSLKTIASRFRNCDQELNSEYISFGDPVKIEAYGSRITNDYGAVLKEMKDFADRYIDLEISGNWLVRALLELIQTDKSINDKAKFLVIPGGRPVYKEELKEMKTIHFYSFLLGVWSYICTGVKEENGKETYSYLSDFVGQSRPRQLKKDRIGFTNKNIEVSYEIELPEVKIKLQGVIGKTLEIKTGSSTINGGQTVSQVFSTSDKVLDREKDTYTIEIEDNNNQSTIDRYYTYLKHAKEKHEIKKTFLYETRRPFYDFFVCSDIKKRPNSYGTVIRRVGQQEKPITNATVDSFPENERCIILSGTGGLGKSMMMTHFLLDTIEKHILSRKIPILILLRDYKPEEGELIDLVFKEFKRHDLSLHLSELIELLDNGKAVILFDGLDEIKKEYVNDFIKEVGVLSDNYPNSIYIISSRPTVNFRAIENFVPYDLQPFSKAQSISMIAKLDQSVIDPQIQSDFIDDLQYNRFNLNYDERIEFLGNPLFLTIMLLSYEGNHEIPTRRFVFYEQAYDVMAKKHDATKGLKREFATELDSKDFQKFFGEFCAITYEQELYDFEPKQIEEAFQDVIEANDLATTPEAFIEDVTGKICLIYLDGNKYYFIHRSFQEYFVAYFFSRQLEQHYDAVREMLWRRDEMDHDSMVLPMLFDMDQNKTELCIILPYLKEFIDRYSGEDGYQKFLLRYYPVIYYEWGETDGIPDNIPESSIYDFIINKYDIKQEILCDSLQYIDSMIDKEYVKYDYEFESESNTCIKLMERNSLPSGYEDWYEETYDDPVEVVGCTYEIDPERAYRNGDLYREIIDVIEDKEFPLFVEYHSVLSKYVELKTKYEKRKAERSGKSFISRFH